MKSGSGVLDGFGRSFFVYFFMFFKKFALFLARTFFDHFMKFFFEFWGENSHDKKWAVLLLFFCPWPKINWAKDYKLCELSSISSEKTLV